jgi:hypothetical protein
MAVDVSVPGTDSSQQTFSMNAILERFRLKEPAQNEQQERDGLKDGSEHGLPGQNTIFGKMDAARAWMANVQIPEWAYLRVEGEQEKLLDAEIEQLQTEINVLKELLQRSSDNDTS